MADWNLPTLTTLYADVLTELKGRDETALKMDGIGTNLPAGAKKLNAATGQFEQFDGTVWSPITSYAKTDTANRFTASPQDIQSNINDIGYFGGVRQDGTRQYLLGATGSTIPLDLRTYDIDGTTILGRIYCTSSGNIALSPKSGTGNSYVYSDLFVYPNNGAIRIYNSAGQASYLWGRATDGASSGWYVGRGNPTADELYFSNYVAGAGLNLTTNGGLIKANGNEIWHDGNANYIVSQYTQAATNNSIDIVIKRLSDYEMYNIKIEGYDYGNKESLETTIGFYDYTLATTPAILNPYIVTMSKNINTCRIYKDINNDLVVRLDFSYQYFHGIKVSVYRTKNDKTDKETTLDQIIFDRVLETTRNYEVFVPIKRIALSDDVETDWQNLTLKNGWVAYTGLDSGLTRTYTPKIRKDSVGNVHIIGGLDGSASTGPIPFTIPSGYSPPYKVSFPTSPGGEGTITGSITIYSDGTVGLYGNFADPVFNIVYKPDVIPY